MTSEDYPYHIYQAEIGASCEYLMFVDHIASVIPVSVEQFWIVNAYSRPHSHPPARLQRLDLAALTVEESYSIGPIDAVHLFARDSENRLWMADVNIAYFDGESFLVFATPPEGTRGEYRGVSLAADGSVWADLWLRAPPSESEWDVVRFEADGSKVYSAEDGLLASGIAWPPLIDYDGNVWVMHYDGISMISDGGWPPMRLILEKVETPETVSYTHLTLPTN